MEGGWAQRGQVHNKGVYIHDGSETHHGQTTSPRENTTKDNERTQGGIQERDTYRERAPSLVSTKDAPSAWRERVGA